MAYTANPDWVHKIVTQQMQDENAQLQCELEVALGRVTKERKEVYELETNNNTLMSFLIRFMHQHEQYTKDIRKLAENGTMPDEERSSLEFLVAQMQEMQDYYHRERGAMQTFYLFKDADECRKRKASEQDARAKYARTEMGLFDWDRKIDEDAWNRTKSQREKSIKDMKKHPRVGVMELRGRYFACDKTQAVLMMPENALTLQTEVQAMEKARKEAAGWMSSACLAKAHALAKQCEEIAHDDFARQASNTPHEEA